MSAITIGAESATGFAQTSSLTVVKRRFLDILKAMREGIARAGSIAYQRVSTLFGGMPKGFWFLAGATMLVHRPTRDTVSGFVGRTVRAGFGLVGRALRWLGRGLTWLGVTIGEKIRGEATSGIRYAIGDRIVTAANWGYRHTTATYNTVVRGLRWVDSSIAKAWDHRWSRNTGVVLGALVLAVLADTFFFGMTGFTAAALLALAKTPVAALLVTEAGPVVVIAMGGLALSVLGITLGAGALGRLADTYQVSKTTKAAPAAKAAPGNPWVPPAAPAAPAAPATPGPVVVQGEVVPMRGSTDAVAASLSEDELQQMAAQNAADEREQRMAVTGAAKAAAAKPAPPVKQRGRSGNPGKR